MSEFNDRVRLNHIIYMEAKIGDFRLNKKPFTPFYSWMQLLSDKLRIPYLTPIKEKEKNPKHQTEELLSILRR